MDFKMCWFKKSEILNLGYVFMVPRGRTLMMMRNYSNSNRIFDKNMGGDVWRADDVQTLQLWWPQLLVSEASSIFTITVSKPEEAGLTACSWRCSHSCGHVSLRVQAWTTEHWFPFPSPDAVFNAVSAWCTWLRRKKQNEIFSINVNLNLTACQGSAEDFTVSISFHCELSQLWSCCRNCLQSLTDDGGLCCRLSSDSQRVTSKTHSHPHKQANRHK